MKKILVISSLGLSLILGVMFLTPTFNLARAGVEPSPFQPEINQLGAVANILNSADFRLVKTMSAPPEPCTPPDPCKGLNGAVNRLEAISNQIGSTENMILSMINEVMGSDVLGVDPSPFRLLLIPGLGEVSFVAEGIVVGIGEYHPTGPVAPEFTEALGSVADSAFQLMETVDESVLRLSEPMACENYDNEATCSDAGCYWDVIGECLPIVD